MSDPERKDNPIQPFRAFAFEARADPDTLSLSDSDPELSDEADVAYNSAEEEDDLEDAAEPDRVERPPVVPFTLKGTDATFFQRSQGIFGALKEVQMHLPPGQKIERVKHQSSSSDDEATETPKPKKPLEKSQSKDITDSHSPNAGKSGQVSQQSGAVDTAKSASTMPDYLTHPERWTKYSLEQVPESSDHINRNAALSFLAELKQKKDAKTVSPDPCSLPFNQDSSSSGGGRILFSKPLKVARGIGEKSESHSPHMSVSGGWEEEVHEKSEATADTAESSSLGFHGVKKRNRKNIRTKANLSGEENSE
ncbi:U5 small nuclear ribonucleoprotein TSSC4 [Pelobates fuscus]|uniref:U5 small nuclear ribonucleoprotein TSSC4 n=1 Tax=Pelobates fuscus TaxID=191477 RepID=UPI002FE4E8EA